MKEAMSSRGLGAIPSIPIASDIEQKILYEN
jgi:hypothetical protein